MTIPTPDADQQSALDEAFVSVWHSVMIEGKKIVTLGEASFSVRRTAKHRLAQIDFEVNGQAFRGLEQNPQTKSRWAQMAREGAKVMQFLAAGIYIAVVADGKIKHFRPTAKS